MTVTEHDKLPDVVLYDGQRNWLFLVEAVTSHGPVDPKRVEELESTLKDCAATRVYVSAFPDFRQFKRHMDKFAAPQSRHQHPRGKLQAQGQAASRSAHIAPAADNNIGGDTC